MADTRIILAGLWTSLMLTYLLGDVLRIFAGDSTQMLQGMQMTQGMWLLIAVIMVIPIVMIVLSLTLAYPAVRSACLLAAVFQVVFNLIGLPYEGLYDNFLIGVSFLFDGLIIYYAWTWAA